jgi:hypothetical protein
VLRRIIAYVLVALGVVVIAVAIASATVWKSSDSVTATLESGEVALVVTDPGVLDMVADQVTVTATAPEGSPVTLAIGRDTDVAGWVGDAAHVQVTGLGSWTSLSSEDVDGAAEAPSPAGSDMWVVEETGTGEVTLSWTQTDGRWSLLAATDGTAPAPTITLTWPQDVRTPFLVPGLVLGGILLVAGLAMIVLRTLEKRETARKEASREARRARGEPVTGEMPAVREDVPGGESTNEPTAQEDSSARGPGPSGPEAGPDSGLDSKEPDTSEKAPSAVAAEAVPAAVPARPLTRRELRMAARAAAAAAAEQGAGDSAVPPTEPQVPPTPASPWRVAWGMAEVGEGGGSRPAEPGDAGSAASESTEQPSSEAPTEGTAGSEGEK